MVLNVNRNHEVYWGRGEGGEGGKGLWGRGRLYTYRYTVTTRMIPALRWMGSDESYFNVLLVVRDKVTRLSTNHNLSEEKGEPKRYRTVVLPLTSLTPYLAKPAQRRKEKYCPHLNDLGVICARISNVGGYKRNT